MRLEFINRVQDGDVLAKSIFTSDGKVLLRAGIKLTDQYIEKLKGLEVLYLYIEDERLDDIYVEDERLSELKQSTMKNISSITKNLIANDRADLKSSIAQVEQLMEYIIEMGDVNNSLNDIKTHDNYTYMHSIDTGIMATFIGINMGIKREELKNLGIAAILHDIGKVKIDNKIINKAGMLTKEEFDEMKNHPVYGVEVLKDSFYIHPTVIEAILQHHERIDGSGYPYGIKGNNISKMAKIVAVCDVYDAVSSDRSYRDKFNPREAYELILSGSDSLFDRKVVQTFRNTFAVYPLGCCLKLSNGVEGYVIRQNKGFPDRPIIRVLYDSHTRKPIPFYEVDLVSYEFLNVVVVETI